MLRLPESFARSIGKRPLRPRFRAARGILARRRTVGWKPAATTASPSAFADSHQRCPGKSAERREAAIAASHASPPPHGGLKTHRYNSLAVRLRGLASLPPEKSAERREAAVGASPRVLY